MNDLQKDKENESKRQIVIDVEKYNKFIDNEKVEANIKHAIAVLSLCIALGCEFYEVKTGNFNNSTICFALISLVAEIESNIQRHKQHELEETLEELKKDEQKVRKLSKK